MQTGRNPAMLTSAVTVAPKRGALVISLDFELHWGVRDHARLDSAEKARLLAARAVVPRLLALFEEFCVHATWATVGFLFARSQAQLRAYSPSAPPYTDTRFDPYSEIVGEDESDDPFHYAPSLISLIAGTPGQEIASHSFSHYYALEAGQDVARFGEDLDAAVAIAAASGYDLRSFVFPRNQANPQCLALLSSRGFAAYRGTERSQTKAPEPFARQRQPHKRLARLADTYVDIFGPQTVSWPSDDSLANISASRYLRAFTPALAPFEAWRLERIETAMAFAATSREIFHLWWHPEDFAIRPDQSLAFLRRVLTVFDRLREREGMQSLSMFEAACVAASSTRAPSVRIGAQSVA